MWLSACFINKVWNITNGEIRSVLSEWFYEIKYYCIVCLYLDSYVSKNLKGLSREHFGPLVSPSVSFGQNGIFRPFLCLSVSLFSHIILCSADPMREQKYTLCLPHVKGVLGSHMEWEWHSYQGSQLIAGLPSQLCCRNGVLPIVESVEFAATWESETTTLFWFIQFSTKYNAKEGADKGK